MTQYRLPVEETFSWQRPIIDKDLSAPPGSPLKGDRYIVGASPTGAWAGHAKHIAWCSNATGPVWSFDVPSQGWMAYVKDESLLYEYNASSVWVIKAGGDMLKSVYDADDDGIVDAAASIDDGTYTASAADISDAVSKKHTAGEETLGGDLSGTVGNAMVDEVGGALAADIAAAVTDSHTQGTDQYLDEGGVSEVSAAQAKEAYDKRGSYDADLGCVLFNL